MIILDDGDYAVKVSDGGSIQLGKKAQSLTLTELIIALEHEHKRVECRVVSRNLLSNT